ncbi:hypothetical protein ACFSSB_08615 [Lacinutrix gracilariae]|uniref:Uncharacterized protein n=1 Tax=Lacinutrix gracilariae TaxID=1747198 RepID=A0ABW5K2Q8_9FLAO
MSLNKKKSENLAEFKIPKEGSLGLLAFGDIGLREWRKVKSKMNKNNENSNGQK